MKAPPDVRAPGAAASEMPDAGATGILPADLAVLARSHWPVDPGDELPAVAGFVTSAFSPLAAQLAEQCLTGYFGTPPADPDRADRMAIVLVSSTGDIGTAAAVAAAVRDGRRVPPLLFYQSNPNAVAGYIAARWGLAGPVVCTMPTGDQLTDALSTAALLLGDGDADAALIIAADAGHDGDAQGVAMLVGPVSWPPPAAPHRGTRPGSSAPEER